MSFKDYLKEDQEIIYNTFLNSLKKNKLSQAYLIKGVDGAPILECALYLAKSIICEEDDFACEKCLDCLRFDEGNYSDFLLLDGKKASIKVQDIEALEKFISTSSLERKQKKIYIINCLENTNKEGLNALLKTLEEPSENIIAFITTENENKLLPTIISRCQVLNLLPSSKDKILKKCLESGIDEFDSRLLVNLYTDVDTISNISKTEDYINQKELVEETIKALGISKENALYFAQRRLLKNINSKEDLRLYLDLICILLKDALNNKLGLPLLFNNLEEDYKLINKNIKDIERVYLEFMLTRGKIEYNVSINLILEHLFIYIIKEGDNPHGRK